jgi:hypothetical protein
MSDKAAVNVARGWFGSADRDDLAEDITHSYEPLVKAIKARANPHGADPEQCWCVSVLRDCHDAECMALRTALRECVGDKP